MSNLNQNLHQDLVMETTHGRKPKCKTEFKAVLNKVLVSGLVLATILGSTTPAFAATLSDTSVFASNSTITQEYGVSVESSIQNIRNTIATIKDMVSQGSVSSSTLKELATQLYALETAVRASGDNNSSVDTVLNEAETVLNSMGQTASVSSTTTAYSALVAVRTSLEDIASTVTIEDYKAPTVTKFTDVNSGHWSYKAVEACRERGAISGKEVFKDGSARFAPTDTVTRAEFLKMAVGVCLGENAPVSNSGDVWWSAVYDYAVNNKIIETNYYSRNDMNKAISRYEMAEIINNCADILLKEGSPDVSLARQLADYNEVGNTRFKTDVYRTYARGIIQGKTGGYYDGVSTGTRAEAAQMLATMMNYIQRADPSSKPIHNDRDGSTTAAPTARTLRWDDPSRPYAREGDTFIAKDGKSYKLTVDPKTGVVGVGLPIAVDLGRVNDGETVTDGGYVTTLARPANSGNQYLVNHITGEGHFNEAWGAISREYYPNYEGKKEGELSKDKNFYWSDLIGGWNLVVANQNYN